MDFIFMLTRQDQTVEDGLDLMGDISSLGLQHIGFKDIGVDGKTLRSLTDAIRAAGATSYLEVVSTTAEDCLNSARVAVDIGVDRLMGGSEVDTILDIVSGSGIEYFPFPGFPRGHPTALGGAPADIADHCRSFMDKGCAGADLLAYRASEADPLDLVGAARGALGDGELIVAGSIQGAGQIADLAAAGVDAFTIGSAIFDGSFSPHKGAIQSRIGDVLAATAAAG